jgi:dTDP-4-dehydrorhamnose 3,5-epimerase
MRFTPTKLDGVVIVGVEQHDDARGHFARTFCSSEFADAGLPTVFVQCNISFNRQRGTLRGLHYQDGPHPEGKLVRCTRGVAFDVAVDIRVRSPTYCRWVGVDLSADNACALWIPPGFAHGFVTLTEDTELFYQITEFYHPELSRGARWDDAAFAIKWPVKSPVLSARDANHPPFVT